MYLFEANLNLQANTSTPDIAQHHLSRTSQPTVFFVGPLVLLREKYLCNTIQARKCRLTNGRTVKCTMIALTGGAVFLSFYYRLSLYFFFKVVSTLKNNMSRIFRIVSFILICVQENLLNIFMKLYHKDLLICFLV